MKVVFVSNYYNHHQKELCEELNDLCKEGFYFIATSEMRNERKTLGYSLENIPDYVLCAYLGEKEKRICQNLIMTADVVIAGSAPYELIAGRIKEHKLIFRYSERLMKNLSDHLKYGYRFLKWHKQFPADSPVYILCASGFTAYDFSKYRMFAERMYRWGYFPETKIYENYHEIEARKDRQEILWCGRFLKWKHPEIVLKAAHKLKQEGYDFHINYIGCGPMEDKLKDMVSFLELEEYITFCGSMRSEKVREYMEHAGIYLFTSDRQEGWGAVLNESMNSGCAVVASHEIGAVPYLIKHTRNGLVYKSGDVVQLYEYVKFLLDHPEEQMRLGKAAYHTVTEEWNARSAAKRLVCLAKDILDGNKNPQIYENGPCSKAEIIKEDWIRKCK